MNEAIEETITLKVSISVKYSGSRKSVIESLKEKMEEVDYFSYCDEANFVAIAKEQSAEEVK